MTDTLRETDLYPPIKTFLESQGYEVKSEIGAADVVACRADMPPVIVEMKTAFSLSLFHQGVARLAMTDVVYIAVPHRPGRRFQTSVKNNKALCRRLGLGLITVRLRDGLVEVHCDPAPYRPRPNKARKARLLREFAQRVGDPNKGGAQRQGLVTAYRQDALACARFLSEQGPSKGALVASATGVGRATRLMADNHYGWFTRVSTGVYDLTEQGAGEMQDFDMTPDRTAQ